MTTSPNESDETEHHIVTFDETANREASLVPSDAEGVESVDELEMVEYNTYGKHAECSCGEYFETHEEGLEHLQHVQSGNTDEEGGRDD